MPPLVFGKDYFGGCQQGFLFHGGGAGVAMGRHSSTALTICRESGR